jgi:HAMP domain-containing protein
MGSAVVIILYFVEVLTWVAIIAVIVFGAFIVFAMPRSITAQLGRLVGRLKTQ